MDAPEGGLKEGRREGPILLSIDAPKEPDTDIVFLRNFLLARAAEVSPPSESESESLAANRSSGGRELDGSIGVLNDDIVGADRGEGEQMLDKLPMEEGDRKSAGGTAGPRELISDGSGRAGSVGTVFTS